MPPTELLARHVRRVAAGPARAGDADGALLDRYLARGDGEAFAALVVRHGPMVRGVCRRVLGDDHAAEDALQATFLVLARRAASVRPRSAVASWLHGVARRVALKARTAESRRRRHETRAAVPACGGGDLLDALSARELLALLDEEVTRLPEAYRAPVVLCGLEGRSQDDAARLLGWTPGSVKGRLERGRRRLHERLARRGVTLPAALLTLGLGQSAGPLPACRAAELADAVLGIARGGTATSRAAALAEDAVKGISLGRLRSGLVVLLAGGVLTAAAVALPAGSVPLTGPQAPVVPEGQKAPAETAEQVARDLYGDPLPAGAVARLGTVRFRNPDSCDSLDFTSDGRFVVSGGMGGARVFEAATGKEVRRLGRELYQPYGPASLSPDGKLVAVGGWSANGNAVYELATGRRLFLFGRDGQNVTPCFSPDGRTVATFDSSSDINLLDALTGERLRSWQRPGSPLFDRCLAFTPDGKALLTAADGGTVHRWDVATGQETRRYETGTDAVRGLVVSPDGSRMAILGYTRKPQPGGESWVPEPCVRVWNLAAGKEARRIAAPPGRPVYAASNAFHSAVFTPDGKALLTSGWDRVLRVWDPAAGTELRRFADFDGCPGAMAFTRDGKALAVAELAVAESGQAVRIRDWATGRGLVPTGGHCAGALAAAVSPDGRIIATGGGDQCIRLWEACTGRPLLQLRGPEAPVSSLIFAPGEKLLVSGEYEGASRVWDLATGKESVNTRGPVGVNRPLAFTPDGVALAVALRDGTVLLLDAVSFRELRRLKGNRERVAGLALTPDGHTAIALSNDRHLHRWDLVTGRHTAVPCAGFDETTWAAAFPPDARLVGLIAQASRLVVADAATGLEVCHFDHPTQVQILAGAFSPDGRTFAWEDQNDQTVKLGEVVSGQVRHVLAGHGGHIRSLAFSADGKFLVSGADDTTALVWDLAGPLDARDRGKPRTAAELAADWGRLADADAGRAYRAVRRLAADPARAVPYLRERLRPVGSAPNAATLDRLAAALDGEQFADREKAFAELDRMGEVALPGLRERAVHADSAEVRRRIGRLLEKNDPAKPSPRKYRETRALEVLEGVGTAEARQVLESLAKGAPEAGLTREAKASLARLDRRLARQP
jgi:RNA polymerase sigma factor (sigma-70 family)